MTQKRIVQLAWHKALEIWEHESKLEDQFPDNEFQKLRTERAWDDVKELEAMLKELEEK